MGCTTQQLADEMKNKYGTIQSYSAHKKVTNAFGDVIESDIIVKRSPDKKLFKETFPDGDMKIIQDLSTERKIYTYDKSENSANEVIYSYDGVGKNKATQTPDFLSLLLSLWEYANVGVETKDNLYVIDIEPKESINEKEKYYIDKESFIPIKIESFFSDNTYKSTRELYSIFTGKELGNIEKTIRLENLQINIPVSDNDFEVPTEVDIIRGPTNIFNLASDFEESYGNQNRWNFIVITPNLIPEDNLITMYRYDHGKTNGLEYKKAFIKTKYYDILECDSFSCFYHYSLPDDGNIEETQLDNNPAAYITFGNRKKLIWKQDSYFLEISSNDLEKENLIEIAKTMNNICGDEICSDLEFDICDKDCAGIERPDKVYEYQLADYQMEMTKNNIIFANNPYLREFSFGVNKNGVIFYVRNLGSDPISDLNITIDNCNKNIYKESFLNEKSIKVSCCIDTEIFSSPITLNFKNSRNEQIKVHGSIDTSNVNPISCESGKLKKIQVTDTNTGIISCQYDCLISCTTFEDCQLGGYLSCPNGSIRKAWNCIDGVCEYIEDSSCQ